MFNYISFLSKIDKVDKILKEKPWIYVTDETNLPVIIKQ